MYTLDPTAARQADNQGAYLKETGKYVGTFTRAEKLVSKNKGTHGIGFTFEANDKRTTRFDIWTAKPNGEHLSGFNTLQAIMTILRLRGIQPAHGKVERYDYDSKKNITVDAEVFPDLTGKPIGLVLRSTEFEKVKDGYPTGETGWRLEPVAPFDAQTEFTASEILDKKTSPTKLANIISTLEDRPLRNRPVAPQAQHQDDGFGGPPAGHPASSGFMDDGADIPF